MLRPISTYLDLVAIWGAANQHVEFSTTQLEAAKTVNVSREFVTPCKNTKNIFKPTLKGNNYEQDY